MSKRLALLTVTLLAIFAGSFTTVLRAQGAALTPGDEQITSYDSDITVNRDSTLLVRETISVSGGGAQFRRGIHRDISTRYKDREGNPYTIHFEVVSLERDGQPVDFDLQRISSGLRVCLGKCREPVPPGEHTYELTYAVDRAIGVFPDYDELYWNVTGSGWSLPLQKVSATIHLPTGIVQQAILLDAFTGRQGSAETAYTASADNQSNATFVTTRPLAPDEDLTIVTRWPKGFVTLPTDEQKRRYFLEDYQAILIGLLGLVVVLIYYLAAWIAAGRNTARGEITPGSELPLGFSPAAIRYVWRKVFDQKTMIVNLVDLAVKKQFAILEDATGAYILGRVKSDAQPAGARPGSSKPPAAEITRDEKLILDRFFAEGDLVALAPSLHALVGGSLEALHHHLRLSLEKAQFLTSASYLVPGLLISVATVIRCGFAIQGGHRLPIILLSIWVILWSLGCPAVTMLAIAAWRYALSDPYHAPTARRQATIMSAICFIFLLSEAAGLVAMEWAASPGVVIVMILMAAITGLFQILLQAPSRLGGTLLNQIECLRLFLTNTEKDPREVRTAPYAIPILFEKFLPYAMALNVEKGWSEKFAAALAETAQAGREDYSPTWYSGPSWDRITVASFATSLGSSFSSAISSSTKAPDSRSRSRRSSRGRGGEGDGGER